LFLKKKTPASTTSAAPKTTVKKGPPRVEERQGTWFCENYENENVTINQASMKENVLISRCSNMAVDITEKVKSISMENCLRVRLNFTAVVSTFEIVNSQRCTIFIGVNCPSVAIDKSSGINVNMTKAAMQHVPDFICSMISECNITVPGKTEEADPQETPIPEQFLTKVALDAKGFPRLTTTPVTHGDHK